VGDGKEGSDYLNDIGAHPRISRDRDQSGYSQRSQMSQMSQMPVFNAMGAGGLTSMYANTMLPQMGQMMGMSTEPGLMSSGVSMPNSMYAVTFSPNALDLKSEGERLARQVI